MTPGLKQRLIGAAVLIALAVIFLPMLVKGPAPESGLPDMPLRVPDAPGGDYKTVDLPLIAPAPAPDGGVLGGPLSESRDVPAQPQPRADRDALPTVDAGATSEPLPPTTAGGGYAVHYAAFASQADAEAILRQLGQSGLTGYREAFTLNGKPAQRVEHRLERRVVEQAGAVEDARMGPRPRDVVGGQSPVEVRRLAQGGESIARSPGEAAAPQAHPLGGRRGLVLGHGASWLSVVWARPSSCAVTAAPSSGPPVMIMIVSSPAIVPSTPVRRAWSIAEAR